MCTKIMAQFNTANCFELTSGLFLLPLSVQGSIFQPHRRTSGGGVKWDVESTTVTHCSADWWDILLPLA